MSDSGLPSEQPDTTQQLPSEVAEVLVQTGNTNVTEEDYDDGSDYESEDEDYGDEDYADDEDTYDESEDEDYEGEDADQDLPMETIFEAVSEEFYENGGITEETYDALVDYGFPQPMIDTYFNGLAALQNQMNTELYDLAGSPENYTHLTRWAETNLSAEEVDAFNRNIDSNDLPSIKLAVLGLMNRYETAEGSFGGNALQGYTGGSGAAGKYASREEWLKDATDPRYDTDASYRNKVEHKYLRSKDIMGVSNLE